MSHFIAGPAPLGQAPLAAEKRGGKPRPLRNSHSVYATDTTLPGVFFLRSLFSEIFFPPDFFGLEPTQKNKRWIKERRWDEDG